jgi:hypothetical protein
MNNSEFRPIDGTSTSNVAMTGAAVDLASVSAPYANAYARLHNVGNQTIFITKGATATAAIGMPLIAGATILVPIGAGVTTWSAIGTAGSTLYCTVGSKSD